VVVEFSLAIDEFAPPVGLTNHKAPSKHNYDEPKHMKTGGGNLGVGGTFFLQEAFYIY
jgi:hypothetical protein